MVNPLADARRRGYALDDLAWSTPTQAARRLGLTTMKKKKTLKQKIESTSMSEQYKNRIRCATPIVRTAMAYTGLVALLVVATLTSSAATSALLPLVQKKGHDKFSTQHHM